MSKKLHENISETAMSFSDLKNNSVWIAICLVAIGAITAVSATVWFYDKLDEKVKATLSTQLRSIQNISVSGGAIVAFDSRDNCPEGWSNYEPASGRVLLGVGDRIVERTIQLPMSQSMLGLKKSKATYTTSYGGVLMTVPEHYSIQARGVYPPNTETSGPEYIGVIFCKKLTD